MTVIAGLIASRFGAIVGGLFLAFPAIFPASATLIERHVRERKEKTGLRGARRGNEAAALDAAGAVVGSFGLAAFGLMVALPRQSGLASRCWAGLSGDICELRQRNGAPNPSGSAPTSPAAVSEILSGCPRTKVMPGYCGAKTWRR
jgi:hypothetical protein